MSKEVQDLNNSDSKEILLNYIDSIQKLDNHIKELNEQKKEAFKELKNEGYEIKYVKNAISVIRKELKSNELEKGEEEHYLEIISNSDIISN